MPDLSSNLTDLQADGHAQRYFMSVIRGDVVLEATVSATPTYPAQNIAMTVTSGDINDLITNMEVEIYSSTDVFKGRLAFIDIDLTSTSLPVFEFSAGTVNVVDGDKIKVRRERRIRNRIVAGNAGFDVDQRRTYIDQNDNYPPICNSGGVWAGFVDPGQTYATVPWVGSESLSLDPDSATTLTHAWTFGSGATPTSSTLADPSAQLPVGQSWVLHIVTDANTTIDGQEIPVMVHDESTFPPYEVQVKSISGDEQAGWSATVQVFENADLDNIPDGAMVIIWTWETINDTRQSFGNIINGRSHIKCVGFIQQDNSSSNSGTDNLTFQIQSPISRFNRMVGFSRIMVNANAPSSWGELKQLTVARVVYQLLRWYTNGLEVFDISFQRFSDAVYSEFPFTQATPFAQISEIVDSRDGRFTSDRIGRLMIQTRAQYLDKTNREALVTVMTIPREDILRWSIIRVHDRPVSIAEMTGITSGGTPMIARWPGNAPADGSQRVKYDRIIPDDRADLNKRAGLRGAFADGVYQDETKYIKTAIWEIELPGSYDVFDFYVEWVALPAITNTRDVDATAVRYTVESIEITPESGTNTVRLRLHPETYGVPGVKYVPSGSEVDFSEDNGVPDYTPIFDFDSDFTGATGSGGGSGADPAATVQFSNSTSTGTTNQLSTNVDVVMTINAGGTLANPVMVNWSATGVSGTSSGTLTFAAGTASGSTQQITITPDYATGNPVVTLSSPSNATLGTNTTHTVTQVWLWTFQFDTASGSADFTTYGDGGFGVVSSRGVYSSGVGWQADLNATSVEHQVDAKLTTTPFTLTSLDMTFDYDGGESPDPNDPTVGRRAILLSDDVARQTQTGLGTSPQIDLNINWSGRLTSVGSVRFIVQSAYNAISPPPSDTGSATVKILKTGGEGACPFV